MCGIIGYAEARILTKGRNDLLAGFLGYLLSNQGAKSEHSSTSPHSSK